MLQYNWQRVRYRTVAKLNNGQCIDYDACASVSEHSKSKAINYYENFNYVGCGVIYSIMRASLWSGFRFQDGFMTALINYGNMLHNKT